MSLIAGAALTVVSALLVMAGVAALCAALSLLCLTLAALARRTPPGDAAASTGGRTFLVVIVPAHNESVLIGRCVTSLVTQRYPRDRFRIVVVADNCSDDTATVARRAGADVLVRTDPGSRGKGRALRWAMDRLLESDPAMGAVVCVDADSVADPLLLDRLESRLANGADVVQGEYLVLAEAGTRSGLRDAAFLLFHRTRFLGRAALGLPCSLVGNGMLFRRSVLEEHPWRAFSNVEDLEHTIDLRLANVRPVFAHDALVRGPAPTGGRAGATQRQRWEGGRAAVARTRLREVVSTMVRRRDLSLTDLVVELVVPPLGLLALVSLAGASLSAVLAWHGAVPALTEVIWIASLVAIGAYVLLGLLAARAPWSAYRALLTAPWFLVTKLATYARLSRGLGSDRWVRTERSGVATSTNGNAQAERSTRPRATAVAGVRIDVVGLNEADELLMSAVSSGTFHQVCTVNMQFLMEARKHADVRAILDRSDLNLADGAPIVWLARVLGCRLPERVSGADLVPLLMASAARTGARVFLLGGENGAAEEAAKRLRARHPRLNISGTYEPAVAPLSGMDDDAIVDRVRACGTDILLVGFGHPKQERWIARNRDRLPVSVAIGVGCCIDLAAGRRGRAPRAMQRCGLEWLYRVAHEPRRLARRYATQLLWLGFVLVPLTLLARLRGTAAMAFAESPPLASRVPSPE